MGKEATRVRRRERKNIASGVAHVNATFNNTMITITDAQGNAIAWSSAGSMGFKGSRKGTPFAAQQAADKLTEAAQTLDAARTRVWDAVTGEQVLCLGGHQSPVKSVCFSRDGKRLASGGGDGVRV